MASAHLLLALSVLFALCVNLVTNEEVDAISAALVSTMIRHTLLQNVRAGFDNGDFWHESYIILPDLNETVQPREEIDRALKAYRDIATFFERSEEPDDKKLFIYMKWAITFLAKLRIKNGTEIGSPLDVELRTCQQDEHAESGNPCKLLAKIKDHIQTELAKGDILGKLARAAEHGGWQYKEIQRILMGMHALILHAVIYRKMLEGVQQKVQSADEEEETGKMLLDNAEQNKQAMQAPKMEFEKDWLEQIIKALEDRYHDYRAIFNRKLAYPIDNSVEKKLKKHLTKLDTMIKPNDV